MRKIQYLFTSLCVTLATSTATAAVLRGGESITPGQRLYSDDGRYFATLQTDGNFLVYSNDGRVIWATYTHGTGAARATMQTDGNFVLYTGQGKAIWSTGTRGSWHSFAVTEHGQAMILTVADWWQTKTGNDAFRQGEPLIFPYGFTFERDKTHYTGGPHSLRFQADGNMVLLRHNSPIWASWTMGATEARVGNGIVISQASGIRFQAPARYKSPEAPGTRLFTRLGYVALFPNGNLVAYRAVPVWKTREYDQTPGRLGNGPHCVGDPHACGEQLHGKPIRYP